MRSAQTGRHDVRAVIQRVSSAEVRVAGEVVGSIGIGLLVLIWVTHTDGVEQADALARKIHGIRILPGELAVSDTTGAGVLAVSQFTLYGDARKGRRPSWSAAAPASVAEPLVQRFVASLRSLDVTVQTGVFGADMRVSLINEGPMTLLLEI